MIGEPIHSLVGILQISDIFASLKSIHVMELNMLINSTMGLGLKVQ